MTTTQTRQCPPEKFTLTLDSELRQQFDHLAAAEDRSVAGTMRMALREYVARKLPGGSQTVPRTFGADTLGPIEGEVVLSPVNGQSAA